MDTKRSQRVIQYFFFGRNHYSHRPRSLSIAHALLNKFELELFFSSLSQKRRRFRAQSQLSFPVKQNICSCQFLQTEKREFKYLSWSCEVVPFESVKAKNIYTDLEISTEYCNDMQINYRAQLRINLWTIVKRKCIVGSK